MCFQAEREKAGPFAFRDSIVEEEGLAELGTHVAALAVPLDILAGPLAFREHT